MLGKGDPELTVQLSLWHVTEWKEQVRVLVYLTQLTWTLDMHRLFKCNLLPALSSHSFLGALTFQSGSFLGAET